MAQVAHLAADGSVPLGGAPGSGPVVGRVQGWVAGLAVAILGIAVAVGAASFGPALAVAAGVVVALVLDRSHRVRVAMHAEQARAEQAERHLGTVLEALGEGIIIRDSAGQPVQWNTAAERILGRVDAAGGSSDADAPPAWEPLREDGSPYPSDELPFAVALRTARPVTDAIVGIRRADGRVVWTSVYAAPLLDPEDQGVVRGVVVRFSDITARRLADLRRLGAEAELREVAATQRASLDAVEQGIALSTLGGAVVLLNRSGERLLGYDHQQLTDLVRSGRWITYREDGSVLPHDERPIVRTMETGEPVSGAIVGWPTALGDRIVLRVSTEPVRNDAGDLVGVVTAFADVTAERTAQAALERSAARFAALVERSTDIICVADGEGTITYASPAAARILGYGDDTRAMRFSDLVHPDDAGELMKAFVALKAAPGAVGSAAVRLVTADGAWRHVEVVATNRLADPAVRGIVANVRDVTERAEAAARLTWQAYHDALTGLPNRALLLDRLHQALDGAHQTDSVTGLMFVDLDGFKAVNDELGHEAGDQLLVEVATRLGAAVRIGDTVARIGGDEFVVLAGGLTSRDEAAAIAARIIAAVGHPVRLAGGDVAVSASVGVAFDRDHDPDRLLREADTALYRAKATGKNRYEVFDDEVAAATGA